MKIKARYSQTEDTMHLYFSDEKAEYSRNLDPKRIVDYSHTGEIVRIRFLLFSAGVKTDDLPYRTAIEAALRDKSRINVYNHPIENNHLDSDTHKEINKPSETRPKPRATTRAGIMFLVCAVAVLSAVFVAADFLFARNLFISNSFPVIVLSVFGLVAALFPTILGCLVLTAWILYRLGKAGHFEIRDYLNSDFYSKPRRR